MKCTDTVVSIPAVVVTAAVDAVPAGAGVEGIDVIAWVGGAGEFVVHPATHASRIRSMAKQRIVKDRRILVIIWDII